MHTYEGSPFADKNLRKAMQYAVDRDFVREAALFGRGSNANDHPVGINDQYYWDDQRNLRQTPLIPFSLASDWTSLE
jgi:ABC-type transport system substrate-binding protein